MSDSVVAIRPAAVTPRSAAVCAACGTYPEPQLDLNGHPLHRCPNCGLYALDLVAARHDTSQLDRGRLEGALRELRLENYAFILRQLRDTAPANGKLLDVGCSSGWFLDLAQRAGWVCYGIEPDEFFFTRARATVPPEVQLLHGSFARDLPAEWGPFDLITFHDVFEHLPEPQAVLRACRGLLTPQGRLVLSLPSADGYVFHIARWLARLGVRQPLSRVFQVDYPYPHLFYFTGRSMEALAERGGFHVLHIQRLRSFSSRGALHRVRMDRGAGALRTVQAYLTAAALVVFAWLEPLLPADNMLVVLSPRPA